jgi:hypothetical protein
MHSRYQLPEFARIRMPNRAVGGRPNEQADAVLSMPAERIRVGVRP